MHIQYTCMKLSCNGRNEMVVDEKKKKSNIFIIYITRNNYYSISYYNI